MATVDTLKISEEEKQMFAQNVKELLRISREQDKLTKEQINRHFAEWKSIAERLFNGGIMLRNMVVAREKNKRYVEDLENLYDFMMKLLGMYDYFFGKMLEDESLVYRSRYAIMMTMEGKEVYK